ncbi:MAG: glycosyltransferase family 2 protein [Saprospiraceae bacterium]|nr:glycosyltransferase family 2 protein [Saprospiraceae bacterium]
MDISVVIPIYNEEENIDVLYNRLATVMKDLGVSYELLFVNDGSKDKSIQLIRNLSQQHKEVRYIDFSRNFGHQVAVSAGLDHTRGNAVVIIDADLQDPPELIKEMYQKVQEGYQVVYAKRRRRDGESFMKLWTAKMFYRILSKITSVSIPVDTGDFRIMDKCIVEALRQMPEKHKFLRGQISWIGYNQTYVEYDRSQRHGGETGYTYGKMIRFALDGITAFSDTPLKMITFFGFFVSGFAFLMSLWALYARFIAGDYEPGWASLIVSVLFIGGIQMIALGIIGEYLMRMNSNVMDRPLYIIRDSNVKNDGEEKP